MENPQQKETVQHETTVQKFAHSQDQPVSEIPITQKQKVCVWTKRSKICVGVLLVILVLLAIGLSLGLTIGSKTTLRQIGIRSTMQLSHGSILVYGQVELRKTRLFRPVPIISKFPLTQTIFLAKAVQPQGEKNRLLQQEPNKKGNYNTYVNFNEIGFSVTVSPQNKLSIGVDLVVFSNYIQSENSQNKRLLNQNTDADQQTSIQELKVQLSRALSQQFKTKQPVQFRQTTMIELVFNTSSSNYYIKTENDSQNGLLNTRMLWGWKKPWSVVQHVVQSVVQEVVKPVINQVKQHKDEIGKVAAELAGGAVGGVVGGVAGISGTLIGTVIGVGQQAVIKPVVEEVVKPTVNQVREHGNQIGTVTGAVIGGTAGFLAGGPLGAVTGAQAGASLGGKIGLGAEVALQACVPKDSLSLRCSKDSIETSIENNIVPITTTVITTGISLAIQ